MLYLLMTLMSLASWMMLTMKSNLVTWTTRQVGGENLGYRKLPIMKVNKLSTQRSGMLMQSLHLRLFARSCIQHLTDPYEPATQTGFAFWALARPVGEVAHATGAYYEPGMIAKPEGELASSIDVLSVADPQIMNLLHSQAIGSGCQEVVMR